MYISIHRERKRERVESERVSWRERKSIGSIGVTVSRTTKVHGLHRVDLIHVTRKVYTANFAEQGIGVVR